MTATAEQEVEFYFWQVRERQQVEEHPVSASTYFLRQVDRVILSVNSN